MLAGLPGHGLGFSGSRHPSLGGTFQPERGAGSLVGGARGPGVLATDQSGGAGPHSQQQPLGSPLHKESRCAPPQVRGGGGSGGLRTARRSGSRRRHHQPLPGQPGTPEGKAGVSVHHPPPRPGLAAPRAAGVAGLSLPAPRTPSAQLPSTPPAPAPPLSVPDSVCGISCRLFPALSPSLALSLPPLAGWPPSPLQGLQPNPFTTFVR